MALLLRLLLVLARIIIRRHASIEARELRQLLASVLVWEDSTLPLVGS